MNTESLVDLLLETMNLKRMPRTGWLTRGVPAAESVADHSFGVALLVLALTDALAGGNSVPVELDVEKALIIALLHDLAEVRLTDLPTSAARLLPTGAKGRAEAAAMQGLLAPLPAAARLRSLWQEFEDGSSPEGRLVRDADKLEMMIQCLRYEQSGSSGLDEFWRATDQRHWHYSLCGDLYDVLKAKRRQPRDSGLG